MLDLQLSIVSMDIRNLVWPEEKWSFKRVTLASFIICTIFLACVEHKRHTFEGLAMNLFAELDSTTTGTINVSRMWYPSRGKRRSWQYDVDYTYKIGDTVHIGKFIDSGKFGYVDDKLEATLMTSKYPVGKEVLVYYDSNRPKFSVLDKGGSIFPVLFYIVMSYSLLNLVLFISFGIG